MTNRAVQAIPVHDQTRLRSDLRQVQLLLESGLPVVAEDRLYPGTPVKITGGSLEGLQGILPKGPATSVSSSR